jgi:tRNA U38,U39,U40 pseudouridine synthase TruA
LDGFFGGQSDAESRVRNVLPCDIDDQWSARGHCHPHRNHVSANGFLRYMVRSIVGTLLAAGRGELDDSIIKRAIEKAAAILSAPLRRRTD